MFWRRCNSRLICPTMGIARRTVEAWAFQVEVIPWPEALICHFFATFCSQYQINNTISPFTGGSLPKFLLQPLAAIHMNPNNIIRHWHPGIRVTPQEWHRSERNHIEALQHKAKRHLFPSTIPRCVSSAPAPTAWNHTTPSRTIPSFCASADHSIWFNFHSVWASTSTT